ncbi:MAG: hypothetical protein GX971_11160 [Firmicutes bacterium]|nr:hypothetical protein [Bacillota bacterium]
MNRYRKMMSLKNEYVQEKSKDEGFQASWLHIAFLLMWLEEHFGVNPNVSVLSQEAVTDFFTWMERDLSYSDRTRLSIATALGEFLTFAYEKEYLEHDLTVCIPAIHA